jgi:hypothetical protein
VKNEARQEKNFEAFLKGEKVKDGISDDMNLQDVFKHYYSKAHSLDISKSKVVNSALSSINSLSSRLEQRR